jgi:hypothetical protein
MNCQTLILQTLILPEAAPQDWPRPRDYVRNALDIPDVIGSMQSVATLPASVESSLI